MIISGFTTIALAITTLCRCPPDNICGYFLEISSAGSSFTFSNVSITLCSRSFFVPIL